MGAVHKHRRKFALFSTAVRKLSTMGQACVAVDLKYMDFSSVDVATYTPVILLHGLLGSKRNFSTVAQSLAVQLEKKRRIVGLDLRNHGDNHHDWREEMNYRNMASDVLHWMDSHNMPSAILVGHSMGGKVAQAIALLEPQRVEGLCVLDIAPVTYTADEPHWKAVQDIVHVLQTIELKSGVTKRSVDEQLRVGIPDPALRAFCLTNIDFATGRWKIHLDAIASQLERLAGFDVDASLQYEGDTFIIHGQQSRFVRHAYMDTIRSYFPNHMLTTIRGAGHWVHAEAPEDTTALLKRFLDR
jgi:esterase